MKDNSLNPVSFIRSRCLRLRHASSHCTKCLDVCPSKALVLAEGQVGYLAHKCVGCESCIAVCPQDCYLSKGISDKELEEEIRRKVSGKTLKISCQRIDYQQENVVVNCLQRIDVTYLAQASRYGVETIEMHTGKCSECLACRNAFWLEEKRIEAENFFELFGKKLAISREEHNWNVDYAKRHFLTNLLNKAEISEQKEHREDEEIAKDPWRRIPAKQQRLGKTVSLLFKRSKVRQEGMNAPKPHQRTFLFEPAIDKELCSGCLLCASVCPTSALLVKKVEEGMVFVAFPQACSNCGLCADVCYQEAIKVKETGITPEYLKNAPKVILSRGFNERLFEDVWEDKLKTMITCPTYRG